MYKITREDAKVVVRNFGNVAYYFSMLLFVPVIIALFYGEGAAGAVPFLISGVTGMAFGYAIQKAVNTTKKTEEVHAIVTLVLVWSLIPLIGALPFFLNHSVSASLIDSYFESVSAITTTGLSVIQINMPRSLVFWRALEAWVGGAGIIITAMVGIMHYTGSSKMFETEGSDVRLRPSIVNSVKSIWWVYSLFTVIGIILLMGARMPLFNSAVLSMSAISTTGTANYYGELIALNSPGVEAVLAVIMMLGAVSFMVHFRFLKGEIKAYFKDAQLKLMAVIALVATFIILPKFAAVYGADALRYSAFHVISALTCGGFNATSTLMWGDSAKMILIFLMVIGGSAGSTAGGIKLIRLWVLIKSMYWKAREKVLPENAYFPRKITGKEIETGELNTIYLFIILYAIFILVGASVLAYSNSAYSAGDSLFEVASAQGNVGITTGITSPGMHWASKIMLCMNMIVGRIEVIPFIIGIGFLANFKKRGV